jgi:PAS domain S-box-containing protein
MKSQRNRTDRLIFFIVFSFICLAGRTAAAEQFENLTVTIGIYQNAPKIFTAESGRPSGIFIDIIEHIAEREGWTLQYIPGTWAEGLERLEKGEIDLMPDVALTPDRQRLFSFHTVPVLSSWSQVYARKDSGIQSILDLNGKKILVLDGSVQEERFAKFIGGFGLDINLIKVPDYQTMFAAVANGEADAAVTNRFYGMMHAARLGLENTAVIFDPSDLFYAAPLKGSKELSDAIDRHLAGLKNNSQSVYYTSLKRWTSEDIKFRLPLWLKIAGIGTIGFLILSLVGSVLLKHQVDLRTRELKLINQEMEQRIAERTAELAAVNKEQHSIFETAGAGIVLMRDRSIVRCNRQLEEIFGYDPGELKGKPTRVWYPDEEAYAIGGQPVYDQLARGETHHRTQQLIRKDGSLFWARVSCRAFDTAFPQKGAVTIIEDITEERNAEEQLRVALDKARESDRIKSAFLATMSHELRTPLNSIIGFTGIMLQGLAGPLNEEQHKQMTMVQNSSRHLLALINDVLDISKIEAGQLELGRAPFDLRASLDKVGKIVTPLAEQKKIDLKIDIADDVGTIVTDQRRLEQVILNLLSNAVKFTDQGRVVVSCRVENDLYSISFTDTGIGMREEELAKIFRPFHQIDTGLARKREGTGLGLSICRKIVDMMGGTIGVESQIGQGSTFTVRIPKQTGDAV